VDLLQEAGFFVNLIEIKSAQTFHSDFLKGLEYFKKILSNRVGSSNLVYAGESEMIIKDIKFLTIKIYNTILQT
jgi:hypothetical protein